ncbi:hydroxymethylbilane synthase [Halobium salinum]|uniref:Hydroxymethylbilane synthase n=1 Tax=Halobium salinum TaxID=1364940 RepID=A0ABD5PG35_9EURY|nr:hydroxymethylbilane synthase [Halobium salinum]
MSKRGTLRLATRGSDLALRQAAVVKDALEGRRYEVELVEVETEGDRIRDELIHRLGRTGAFVRALDERVLDGDVDAAVHSMKDMPTESPPELEVAGVPERGAAGDLLVTPDGTTLHDLPRGATVGTSSLRRKAQLLAHRSDLDVQPLRGNVDTRVEKLLAPGLQREHEARLEDTADEKGNVGREARGASEQSSGDEPRDDDFEPEFEEDSEEWFQNRSELEKGALGREVETEFDAIVLAEAGLERSGLLDREEISTERLPWSEFVPAPGQGALAVTAARGETADAVNDVLDHPRSRVETTVERTVLGELGGGCVAPIGVHAVLQGSYVHTVVRVLSQDGEETVEATRDLPVTEHATGARDFASDLRERGAAELIQAAKRDAGGADADDDAASTASPETDVDE